ncbi:pectinesterase [Diospyros lotus]|uniref:pectinesterase n=1 Tax=Diospyros lotus TaxID=55363 RepID=UPI00224F1EBA|nr:pectinesterase [Diospyros lotus]
MAFQDFDHISERRRRERQAKRKKIIIIATVSILVVLLAAAAAVAAVVYNRRDASSSPSSSSTSKHGSSSSSKNKEAPVKEIAQNQKAIKMICSPTDYKKACESSLSKEVPENSSASPQPKDFLKAAISVTAAELKKAVKEINSKLKFDSPEEKAAFEDCKVLFEDAMEELNSSISDVEVEDLTKLSSTTPDLNNWLSAVISYQQTCIDGFPDGELKTSMQKSLKSTKELTSNALAIIAKISSVFSSFSPGSSRHLLADQPASSPPAVDEDGLPSWISHEDRRMLKAKTVNLAPNVTVAKDGSGNYSTISAALAAIPEKFEGRYVIYVKEGIYDETVIVTKKMVNITMFGDGSQKSVVTGNKNFVDGVRTFQTATFAVIGEGFMAQSMGFRNTAGPEKHQAVALRVQSDRSIFVNCRMEGYQDTLYAQTHRQFYRSCLIKGTIDFIFGDAAAIFQNCMIYIRKPLENQQNIVTAQGRADRHETTGIVLQNCKILADETLEPEKSKFKSYLGRPWKEYSRTIVMESEICDLIHPDGWLPWDKDFALKTLFYAEFNNKGAGSSVSKRVKWPGYKVITKEEEVMKFTVGPFIQGESWLKPAGVPVRIGLF